MKQLCMFLIFIQVIACFYAINSQNLLLSNRKSKQDSSSPASPPNNSSTPPESKILWEGWLKYFIYNSAGSVSKPTQFFVNNSFMKQKVLKNQLYDKDDKGVDKHITNKFKFYGKLMMGSLNILSEKFLSYGKTVDTLNVDMIKPLDATEPLKGSIKDIGTFKEGSCISIEALFPDEFDKDFLPIVFPSDSKIQNKSTSKPQTWIICVEDSDDKDKLFSYLITYKLLRQKEQGIELVLAPKGTDKDAPTPKFERYTGSDAKPEVDGYLVLLQDWTGCTLKCGGGQSFQQWRCIPPKKGGRVCTGELIRKKTCNTQACPGVSMSPDDQKAAEQKEQPVVFKPIFKSAPFIDRPQQNVTCSIIENDVLFETVDKDSGFTVQEPGRLLMNNRTIGLFTDASYENSIFLFSLDKTTIFPYADDYCCFFIESLNQREKICALSNCGNATDHQFVYSWQFSFSKFQQKCFNNFNNEVLKDNGSSNSTITTQNSPEEKSSTLSTMNISEDEISAREEIINNKMNEDSQVSIENKLSKTQNTALKAISREMNIEEKIKREEMMKAKQETKTLILKMHKEKQKKAKLEEAIDSSQAQQDQATQTRAVEQAITQISTDTDATINKKRIALKKKIMEIRKTTERRKRLIENKINLIRGKMAQEVVQATKQGNADTCLANKKSQTLMNSYCDSNIISDYKKNEECKIHDNHCYICCESEFGLALYNNRMQCYDKCDQKPVDHSQDPRGNWIWKDNTPPAESDK